MQEEIDRLKESNKTKDTQIELAHREIQESNLKISNLETSCASLQKVCEGLEVNGTHDRDL